MRTISNAKRGALLLCAALSLASCATPGNKLGTLPAIKPELQVVERRVYAPIPAMLTVRPVLPQAPQPAGLPSATCLPFCYSNAQLTDMLRQALSAVGDAADRFRQIEALSGKAVETNKETKP